MPAPILLPGFRQQPQLSLAEIAQNPKQPFMVATQNTFKAIAQQSDTNQLSLAFYFEELLRNSDRLSPKEAKVSDLTKVVRVVSKYPTQSPKTTALKTEFLAYLLGISSATFLKEANVGFKEFAEGKPPLAPYLAHYDHTLQVDPLSGEILILVAPDSQYQPWSSAKKVVDQFKQIRRPKTSQPCFYGQNGLQAKDLFEWKTLEPMDITRIPSETRLDTTKYFVEICSCTEERPKLGGDHSWTRLIILEHDDSNNCLKQTRYSVGLYSPYGKPLEQQKLPLAVQPGFLQSEDVSEHYPFEINTIRREISKDQFEKIKGTFEKHKQEEVEGRPQPIQLCGYNCTAYAMQVSREAGVQLPDVTEDGLYLLGQTKELAPFGKVARYVHAVSPSFIPDSLRAITAVAVNIIFLHKGASQKHAAIQGHPGGPLFYGRSAIWNTRIITPEHPWGVRRVAREEALQQVNNQHLETIRADKSPEPTRPVERPKNNAWSSEE